MSLFHRKNPFIFKRHGISLLLLMLMLGGCFHDEGGDEDFQTKPRQAVTLSGVLSIASTVVVDTDVNDNLATYASNDTIANAQQISNPVTLGGYVNRANRGSFGRSSWIGDPNDYYTTKFVQGQVITLTISNYVNNINDLALSLLDPEGGTVGSSVGASDIRSITVPESGTYVVRVQASRGASNYTLSIGFGVTHINSLGPNGDLNVNDDFVPGQVIVSFRDGAQPLVGRQTLSQRATGIGMRAKAGAPGRSMLMTIDNPQQRSLAFSALGISAKQPWSGNVTQHKQDTLDVIKALRRRVDVKSARPNYIRKPLLEPNDQRYPLQWHYPFIHLPQAWDITTGTPDSGETIIVAVVDTGVLLNHPDLQNQLVTGYDFISDAANSGDGEPGVVGDNSDIDDNPHDVGDGDPPAQPSSFHGTHVAGTIAAETDVTSAVGVAGVAWGAKIMPLRVLGKDGGTDYDIEQAIAYAARLTDADGRPDNDSKTLPPRRADIINLSLGGPTHTTTTPDVYVRARAAGVIIIAAAGNSGKEELSYPASLTGVVSVSAINLTRQRTSYSNFGATVDVAAPGGDNGDLNSDGYEDGVLSTLGSDANGPLQLGYGFYRGTSMAAPHVAGVAALMKAVDRNMSPGEFDGLLASGRITEALDDPGLGHGLIDAYKAVAEATALVDGTRPTFPPVALVNPDALNFSFDRDTSSFRVTNGGDGTLTATTPEITYDGDSQDWLTVTPPATTDGLGTYDATVNRDAVVNSASNVHTAVIRISTMTDTNITDTVSIPVIMLLSGPGSPNKGYHYITLLNTETQSRVSQVQGQIVNGLYRYQFTDVPAGTYIVVANTDSDNDGFLCDAGETCGAYPTLGSISDLVVDPVDGDISGINFEASFNLVIKTNSLDPTLLTADVTD